MGVGQIAAGFSGRELLNRNARQRSATKSGGVHTPKMLCDVCFLSFSSSHIRIRLKSIIAKWNDVVQTTNQLPINPTYLVSRFQQMRPMMQAFQTQWSPIIADSILVVDCYTSRHSTLVFCDEMGCCRRENYCVIRTPTSESASVRWAGRGRDKAQEHGGHGANINSPERGTFAYLMLLASSIRTHNAQKSQIRKSPNGSDETGLALSESDINFLNLYQPAPSNVLNNWYSYYTYTHQSVR
ncbi:hypothetical protein V8F06_002983 [Rhypophila decipiens]